MKKSETIKTICCNVKIRAAEWNDTIVVGRVFSCIFDYFKHIHLGYAESQIDYFAVRTLQYGVVTSMYGSMS